ncbi:type VI secretion system amidase effector protein Tae4 [Delftia sp. PS-11]|uniref:type VI secretion system amidase effector protein Tae4 n=1 Tax=Delftia sp. PS-11 TaxID=2767222 RepID=UPI00245649F7|nr:type VI secretion system amidase effector protein Tae4 [Delftia sp. PS-11]
MSDRPKFSTMWNNFLFIYGNGSVQSVGKKIGGKVEQNIEIGISNPDAGFRNACAIRMSYALNHSGFPVSKGTWTTSSGRDKSLYIFRLKDMHEYLVKKFGKPDYTFTNPKASDLISMKGILSFNVTGWSDATGHITLWDGNTCSDHCYFQQAKEAFLWSLK